MHSFLITSKDKTKREQYALAFCEEQHISSLDITIIDKYSTDAKTVKKAPESIGIERIKKLQQRLYLKPLKSLQKACVINDAQLLTTEAQNAMLKFLEEPPDNTIIFLTASTKEALLPTILSRCQVIELLTANNLSEKEGEELYEQIERLRSLTVSDSLQMAETIAKNKDEALLWLENIIITMRTKLLLTVEEGSRGKEWYVFTIRQFQKTYETVKTTNTNLRLTLEHLFLSLIQ
jgi:DNA polymerase III delta prime subunit